MPRWIRQLFRSTPTAPVVKQQRIRLGLYQLEDRTTPATLFVNSLLDDTTSGNGLVTLREAINAANNNTTTDLGQTGSGADTISFTGAAQGGTVNLSTRGGTQYGPNALEVTSPITIQGSGETIRPTTLTKRLFFVADTFGNLTLSNLTLSDGYARGGNGGTNFGDDGGGGGGGMGAGGAIYNRGTLTINSCLFTGNTAQGGAGGDGADNIGTDAGGGGGGGGMGGYGGNVSDSNNDGGAGGGGFFGTGGGSGLQGGGGGSGTTSSGSFGSGTSGGIGGVSNGGNGGSFQANGSQGGYGGGGGGGSDEANGGNGGIGGGGGGGGENDDSTLNSGGAGGFGGGGGGGGEDNIGGNGGYGAGSGGASSAGSITASAGLAGNGGGTGGSVYNTPARGSGGGGGGSGQGGAIFNDAGTMIVSNSTFSGNVARGGGPGASFGAATSGSSGDGWGGGIKNYNGTLTVIACTFTANTADTGRGIMSSAIGTTATVTMHNSILGQAVNNSSDFYRSGGADSASSGVGNLIRVNGGLFNGSGFVGTIVTNADPLLQPLANNGGFTKTHALGQNSPALTAGSASILNYVPWDQRGAARDSGAGIQANPDIGAYEVNHPLATVGAPTTLADLYQPKPSASANEAFVKGLYQSTLLRAPDTAGLNGWVAQLNSGTSRSTVANGFVNSTENRRAQVTFFYRYFLSREPDTAGLNGWVSQLQAGADEGQVMTGFILSNEFSGLNTNSQFVNLMYYALLSRQADTAGFNGWISAINGGMSRGTVVNAFLRSEEGLNRVINSLFQVYLKRYGSTGDLSAFRSYLNTNTFGQAATLMLASAEFFTNAGNNLS